MVLSLFNPFLSLQDHFINHTRKSIPLLHIDFPCLITNCKRKKERKKIQLNQGFISQSWHLQASGSFQNSTDICLLALNIHKYKQWQRYFEQWLLCCNTCSIKVTLFNENIHLNVLIYLWKTRSNP